ncbi:NfeD family protein [Lentisphaerota bacterium ZTH]|nr:hypothetical protein JYG24_12885 [Lentisphaerota bacterium]WET05619.1 NfeD family protein [Lentisphaerota bacterium ZTH]
MRYLSRFPVKLLTIAVFAAAMFCLTAATTAKPRQLKFIEGARDVVYFVPQFSEFKEISSADLYFLKKTLDRAAKEKVKAVIFELDTPGGRIDVALKYVSVLAKSKVPVIAYLNPQGISAGMIIAIAADRIAINPDGVIGDAMPIQMGPGGIKPITDDQQRMEREQQLIAERKSKQQTDKTDKKTGEKKQASDKAEKPDKDQKSDKTDSSKEEKKTKDGDKDRNLFERLLKQLKDPKESELAKQKFLTVFFKVLQALAEKNGRPVRVIRAMADPYQKLTVERDGIKHTRISPLTLTAREAKKLGVVDYICDNRIELLNKLNMSNCKLEVIEKSATDQLISFLSHPAIAGILIVLGIVGIYVEIKTPGFGVPGILGVTALTLFFLGHVGSGASEWGPIVIFFVGLVLLLLEIFVIPGFGIVGVLGIGCIVISFFAAFGFENIETATYTIGSALGVALAIIIFLTVYVLPKSPLFKWIKLETTQKSERGFSAHADANKELLHKHGIAHSMLRPVGIAIIDGKRLEVTTEGDFINKGDEIEVTEVTPFKIIVEKVNNA